MELEEPVKYYTLRVICDKYCNALQVKSDLNGNVSRDILYISRVYRIRLIFSSLR